MKKKMGAGAFFVSSEVVVLLLSFFAIAAGAGASSSFTIKVTATSGLSDDIVFGARARGFLGGETAASFKRGENSADAVWLFSETIVGELVEGKFSAEPSVVVLPFFFFLLFLFSFVMVITVIGFYRLVALHPRIPELTDFFFFFFNFAPHSQENRASAKPKGRVRCAQQRRCCGERIDSGNVPRAVGRCLFLARRVSVMYAPPRLEGWYFFFFFFFFLTSPSHQRAQPKRDAGCHPRRAQGLCAFHTGRLDPASGECDGDLFVGHGRCDCPRRRDPAPWYACQ
jgi:hypothetical protein